MAASEIIKNLSDLVHALPICLHIQSPHSEESSILLVGFAIRLQNILERSNFASVAEY